MTNTLVFRVLSVTGLDLSHALPADLFRHHARSPKGYPCPNHLENILTRREGLQPGMPFDQGEGTRRQPKRWNHENEINLLGRFIIVYQTARIGVRPSVHGGEGDQPEGEINWIPTQAGAFKFTVTAN